MFSLLFLHLLFSTLPERFIALLPSDLKRFFSSWNLFPIENQLATGKMFLNCYAKKTCFTISCFMFFWHIYTTSVPLLSFPVLQMLCTLFYLPILHAFFYLLSFWLSERKKKFRKKYCCFASNNGLHDWYKLNKHVNNRHTFIRKMAHASYSGVMVIQTIWNPALCIISWGFSLFP